jgi:hypothetical protein
MPTFRNHLSVPSSKAGYEATSYPAFEDGTDIWFRNVGMQKSDAGDTWIYPAFEDGTDRWFRNVGMQKSEAGGTWIYPAFEDGTDRWFRNVGMQKSEAEDTPKRLLTISKNTAKV